MSGGSLDYVYHDVEQAIEQSYISNEEAEEAVRDIADLLHDIEWSMSGDYAPDEWKNSMAELSEKWADVDSDQSAKVTQTSEDMEKGVEGSRVPCPRCSNDPDMEWVPRPFVSSGSCHHCGAEFDVMIEWGLEGGGTNE